MDRLALGMCGFKNLKQDSESGCVDIDNVVKIHRQALAFWGFETL